MELDYAAWQALVGAHTQTLARLDRKLTEAAGLSSGEFEILKHLKDAGGRLRMSRLADKSFASRSGLTRRIDRLAQRGLVVRQSAAEDGRGQYAVLLPAGDDLYEEYAPVHRELLTEGFRDVLDEAELASLTGLLSKLVG